MLLTQNAITTLLKGPKNHLFTPTLQIIEITLVNKTIRLSLSDSTHHTHSLSVCPQITLPNHSDFVFQVIRLIKYNITVISGVKSIIVNDIEIGPNAHKLIGSPLPFEPAFNSSPQVNMSFHNDAPQVVRKEQAQPENCPDDFFAPISALSINTSDWTIKARVVKKSAIKTWKNLKSEGRLFTCVLVDSKNEIAANFFNSAADLFFNRIIEGRVYTFSGGMIKHSNPAHLSVDNEIEINFDRNSQIKEVADDNRIAKEVYNFMPLDHIPKQGLNKNVDVCGFILENTEPIKITSRKGEDLLKRSMIIMDHTGYSIEISLWGELAISPSLVNMDISNNPLICLKNLKVKDFNKISLSSDRASTSFKLNPERNPYIDSLLKWKSSQNTLYASTTLSERKRKDIPLKTAAEIKDEWTYSTYHDKTESFRIIGILGRISITEERLPWYQSCGMPGCKKKVKRDGQGLFYCEACNLSLQFCEYRFLVNLNICDCTGDVYAITFDEVISEILGCSARRLNDIYRTEPEQADEILAGAFGRYVNAIIRVAAADNKIGFKFTVKKLEPFNPSAIAQLYMDEIFSTPN